MSTNRLEIRAKLEALDFDLKETLKAAKLNRSPENQIFRQTIPIFQDVTNLLSQIASELYHPEVVNDSGDPGDVRKMRWEVLEVEDEDTKKIAYVIYAGGLEIADFGSRGFLAELVADRQNVFIDAQKQASS